MDSLAPCNATAAGCEEAGTDSGESFNPFPLLCFAGFLSCAIASAQVGKRVDVVTAYVADLLSTTFSWWIISVGLTLYNKYYFKHLYGTGVQYPLLLSTWHMALKGVIAAIVLRTLTAARNGCCSRAADAEGGTDPAASPKPVASPRGIIAMFCDVEYMKVAVPIGITTGLDIGLSNWAIGSFISVSMYTITKTSVLVFTYIVSVILRMQPARCNLTAAIAVVCAGIATAASTKEGGDKDSDTGKVFIGLILTLCAAGCGAVRWVFTEYLLKRDPDAKKSIDGKFRLLMCISPAATLATGVLAFPFELSRAMDDPIFDGSRTFGIAILGSVGGIVAIALIFVEFALVHMASALTLSICGHMKDILSIIFAIIVFSEPCPPLKAFGMVTAFCGSSYYIYLKMMIMKVAAQTARAAAPDTAAGKYDVLEGSLETGADDASMSDLSDMNQMHETS